MFFGVGFRGSFWWCGLYQRHGQWWKYGRCVLLACARVCARMPGGGWWKEGGGQEVGWGNWWGRGAGDIAAGEAERFPGPRWFQLPGTLNASPALALSRYLPLSLNHHLPSSGTVGNSPSGAVHLRHPGDHIITNSAFHGSMHLRRGEKP